MIVEKTVWIKVTASNICALREQQNANIKLGDIVEVSVDKLSKGSHAIITAICDDCGNEVHMEYRTYLRIIKKGKGYRCDACNRKEQQRLFQQKYGVANPFQLEEVKTKSRETNLRKYGHEYTMQRPEYKKKFLLGEANNSYIDGRSKNSDCRNSSALKTWRREVYERDGYKCQVCGATREETDIEAHHLENFADNQDKRLDVNNGVTLCVKHHKLFHQIYGYHNTTPEQYQEFAKGQTTIPDECREVQQKMSYYWKCIATYLELLNKLVIQSDYYRNIVGYSNRGYGLWKEYGAEINKYLKLLTNAGYTVFFIAHEGERAFQNEKGEEYTKIYPRGDKRVVDPICDLCDIIGYAQIQPETEDGEETLSTLYLVNNPAYQAGSRFTHIVKSIPEWNIEKLDKALSDAIEAEENESGMKAATIQEAQKKAAKARKAEAEAKLPLEDLIDSIGTKLQAMNEKTGSIDEYAQLMDDLGIPDTFKATNANESQRQQLEMLLDGLVELGY